MDAVFRELFLVVTRRRGEAVAAALAAMDFGFWRSILVAFALAFLGCFFLGAFTTDGLLADCKSADMRLSEFDSEYIGKFACCNCLFTALRTATASSRAPQRLPRPTPDDPHSEA